MAPTGRAARELTEEAGIPARTLDRLLIDLEQLGDELPRGCVLILDEAGMAATRPSARLLQAAEQARREGHRHRRPRPARLGAGRWLARRRRPRARCPSPDRGDAPARPGRAPSARRPARASSTALPGLGWTGWTHRHVQRPGRRVRAGARRVGASECGGRTGAGRDDRQGQRHARGAEHRSPRALEGSRAARRGALLRLG